MCLLLLGDSPGSTDEDPGLQRCREPTPADLPPRAWPTRRVGKIRLHPRLSNTVWRARVSSSGRLSVTGWPNSAGASPEIPYGVPIVGHRGHAEKSENAGARVSRVPDKVTRRNTE